MLKLLAPAKINLFLSVIGKRQDGYHELETILQKIELYDTIVLEEKDEGVELECEQVPGVENLVYQAASLLKQELKIKKGVKIRLEKNIPIAAGLGGGSSDAATTLIGLNKLWELGLSQDELIHLASKLGADVPFFINDCGLAYATGIGTIITPLPDLPPFWLVMILPEIKISTAKVYADLNFMLTNEPINSKIIEAVIKKGNIEEIPRLLFNTLEQVVLPQYPMIKRLKEELLCAGCLGVLMSGSGSTVFGIARTQVEADNIYHKLRGGEREKEIILVTKSTGGCEK
ncbi:MAG: 4-(cytidine 5'-diphospho)-2-C-methyl-D-erythritol kinase [bacterium]|nr:4-(cytidine 5'-diphospho)-2-C-methyl-D-erythritol kinase [bacterium]